ncbi:MAG TPA: MbnP family protein [Bacteroidales bacterium]
MHLPKNFIIFLMLVSFFSCKKKEDPETVNSGRISFYFDHKINGSNIDFDTLNYTNAAGNHYMVNEIQYFISDVVLYKNDGSSILLDAWEDIHYVDTDLPETREYAFQDEVPAGIYDSISFIFGISEEKNQSLMFVNPPESNMFWPEVLGGGYHYMKLNGKWKNPQNEILPFNFHLGIGQIVDTASQEITGFVQNYFRVSLPGSGFSIAAGDTLMFNIIMNAEEWFENPNTFDFNYWGSHIMQNQAAMQAAKENGHNVFVIYRIGED